MHRFYRRAYEIYRKSAVLKAMYRKFTSLQRHLSGEREVTDFHSYSIELSSICNARCVFCSYPAISQIDKSDQNMTDLTFGQVLDFIKKKPKQAISLTPIVGEIFVNKNWNIYLQEILDISDIKYVGIITNGILLTERNLKKLIALRNVNKLGISISVGGLNRSDYETCFGVDKFHRVSENINRLVSQLKERNLSVPVRVELRLIHGSAAGRAKIFNTFNQANYSEFYFGVVRKFDPLHNLPKGHSGIVWAGQKAKKQRACRTLSSLMFAANGDVRLCGCVMSMIPKDLSMVVGTAQEDPEVIRERLEEKVRRWEGENVLPLPCQSCTDYVARL